MKILEFSREIKNNLENGFETYHDFDGRGDALTTFHRDVNLNGDCRNSYIMKIRLTFLFKIIHTLL